MELRIGTNIKRLRLEKGLTQEQLAALLCVSAAAVSKWEAKNTYPDITMLVPLAGVFGVSVDALLGYDEARAQEEVDKRLAEYRTHYRNGRFAQARAVLDEARRAYPHDYRIMNAYMWDRAEGFAGNRPEVLLAHREEFTQICDCILSGCGDEGLRLDALNMKAKLLHAQGDTEGALALLSLLPDWAHSAEQKKEQLFAKDTPEYRRWNRRNLYGLIDIMANKLARLVWYDDALDSDEKRERVEGLGDAFFGLCQRQGFECLCVAARMLYAELAERLSGQSGIRDVIHVREKEFAALEKMTALAACDEVFRESVVRTYGTADPLSRQIDWLLHTEHPQLAALRSESAYTQMLAEHQNRLGS